MQNYKKKINVIIDFFNKKTATKYFIKKNIKFNDVSMATAEDVKKITGFTIGGVSPVGHLENVDIYIDNSLHRFVFLFAAAGHPNCIFKINFSDLKKITKGKIEDITE